MGIRGVGRTQEEAFAQVAAALTAVITDPDKILPQQAAEVMCVEQDDELLLFSWLNTLLCEMAIQNMLFCRFDIQITGGVLKATVWGEPVDAARHCPAVEVKAATYSDLRVCLDGDGNWIAQCVVDI